MLTIPKHLEPELVKRCNAVDTALQSDVWEARVRAEIAAFARENSVRLHDHTCLQAAFEQYLEAL